MLPALWHGRQNSHGMLQVETINYRDNGHIKTTDNSSSRGPFGETTTILLILVQFAAYLL